MWRIRPFGRLLRAEVMRLFARCYRLNQSLKQRLKVIASPGNSHDTIVESLRSLRDEGVGRRCVLDTLEELRGQVLAELEQDVILEVMDYVVGFCSPAMRIWHE